MKVFVPMVSPLSLRPLMLRTTALAGVSALAVGITPAAAQVCDPTVLPLPAGCEAPNAGLALAVSYPPQKEHRAVSPGGTQAA